MADKYDNNEKGKNNMSNHIARSRMRNKTPNRQDYNRSKSRNNTGGSKSANGRRNMKDNRSRSRSNTPLEKNKSILTQNENIDRAQLVDLEIMDPENIIIFFSRKNTAFSKLLSSASNFNFIVLILRVISKLCMSSFNEYKSEIILEILKKDFVQKLQNHILNLAHQDEKERRDNIFFWEDQTRFWRDLIILYNTILDCVPKNAFEKLPQIIKANVIAIKNMNKDNKDQTEVNNLDDVIMKLELFLEKVMSQKEAAKQRKRFEFQNPKDSFRDFTIYPTVTEITSEKQPFLRPIITDGSYESVEQYLDILFRLSREDYVKSLRDGICTYLKNQKTNQRTKQQDVQIYENVKFVRPHIVNDRVGILISFSVSPKNDISNENKQFMYGSLVCFTRDNFKSVVYGTVVDNDSELLKSGHIAVDVQDTIIYNTNYIMVESTIFFETCYHVLKALQNMKEENFPLKKYIVDVNTKIEHPKYLNGSDRIYIHSSKKAKPVIVNGKEIKFFKMLSQKFWPPAEYFQLNSAQYKAFQTALTSEFSVIHGPPGTGKTYTSLKIVKFLLKYKHALKYTGPILVICCTNHTLDKFLEGILPFSSDLMRVGGQSKNPKLDDLNLRYYRRKVELGVLDSFYKDLLETEKKKVDQCVQKLRCLQNLLEDITSKIGILDFKHFKKIDVKFENSWFDRVQSQEIIDWLMEGINKVISRSNNEPDEIIEHKAYSIENELNKQTTIINIKENYNSEKHFINNYILTLPEIKNKINNLEKNLADTKARDKFNFEFLDQYESNLKEQRRREIYLEWRLNQKGFNTKILQKINYYGPHNLSPDDRWNLYRYWVHLLHLQVYEDIAILDEEYRATKRRYQEVQQIVDVYILQEKEIIGMTTSGAARLQSVLQTLKCQIVIVEEAAEVLESHVIAALTNHCQQLILIGDHLQLRPNTAQYNLAKQYNLEISLFERMINNQMHCQQLDVQHRMRPEFSQLITPAIYSNLKNEDSVLNYDPVRGVTKNLFFVTHTEFEQRLHNTTSHRNIYEAKYVLKLASYLVKQGYSTEEITILTTYNGQISTLSRERKDFPELENIRISVVDNFQGEENKIILLSLVRSNERENIGFLKIENRVCVALSRAREGFFIIGNMDNLEKSSIIWPKIIEVLVKQNSIGPTLTLKCQSHSIETQIKTYVDFEKVSDGGCDLYCGKKLRCGHICALKCHYYDREHEQYYCKEPCTKSCEKGHPCQQLCSDKCKKCAKLVPKSLPCGHSNSIPCSMDPREYKCTTKINVKLPCGHSTTKECNASKADIVCPYPCKDLIKCGHKCQRQCHINDDPNHEKYSCGEPCDKYNIGCTTRRHKCRKQCSAPCDPCLELVAKKQNCSHTVVVACNFNVNLLECMKNHLKILPCGHLQLCSDKCKKCVKPVLKTLPCGHYNSVPCSMDPREYKCITKIYVKLRCGHSTTKECTANTTDIVCPHPCEDIIKCGHKCQRQCHINDDPNHEKYSCREPCDKYKIGCTTRRHKCRKHCSAPCDPCLELVAKKRDCSHTVTVACNFNVIQFECMEDCLKKLPCGHRCPNKCYMPCGNCQVLVNKKLETCQHTIRIQCGRQIGTRNKCESQCQRILNCGHICQKKCYEECFCPRRRCISQSDTPEPPNSASCCIFL